MPLYGGYVITSIDGAVTRTGSYYIESNRLHVSEGEPLKVYEVRSVRPEGLSQDELREHEAAMQAFRSLIMEIQASEREIVDAQAAVIREIQDLGVVGRTDRHIDPARKKELGKELVSLKEKALLIAKRLRQSRLPDFSLLKARDIKLLQVLSLEESIEQTRRYLKKADPSSIAYAEAQLRQAASFNESFQAALPWK